ncbi:MAG: ABC transporter substrate-binding protein [Anaerolinea sp.]|nr:ABC transporter substrate-binding protein [Anaerolinea sp.]
MVSKTVRFLLLLVVLAAFVVPAVAQDATPEPAMMGVSPACADPASLSGDVSIGVVFGLSGNVSVYGLPQRDAVQLAVDQINEAGYLGGATLYPVFEDSAGDREQAIAAVTRLVDQGVTAIIGPTLSSEMTAAGPVAQEAGVLILGVSNTASGLRELLGDFYMRASLPESAVIPGTIAQATESLGLTRVGVLYGNDNEFTVSGYEVFVEALDANEVEIVGEETFATGDVDFNAQLTNLISQEPDALVVSALAAEATQIILQARALGYTGTIIGGNGFNSPAVLNQTGADSNGLIVGGAWNYSNPNPSAESVGFVTAFEEAYGYSPDQFAAQAYTGTWLIAEAIRCADSTDSAVVRDALLNVADFASPLGVFGFDEAGEPVHEPIAQIVVDGRFVPLSTVEVTPEG